VYQLRFETACGAPLLHVCQYNDGHVLRWMRPVAAACRIAREASPGREFLESAHHFSEQDLLQLLDLQQHTIKASKKASISQSDVDKLFQ